MPYGPATKSSSAMSALGLNEIGTSQVVHDVQQHSEDTKDGRAPEERMTTDADDTIAMMSFHQPN